MVETADPKVIEGPSRKRRARSAESIERQKETRRVNDEARRAVRAAYLAREAERRKSDEFLRTPDPDADLDPTPEAVVDVKTGFTEDDREAMDQVVKLQQAEARIREAAISENAKRLMVHQEIKVDEKNTLRRYVELTPSMCDVRNCPFDAAKETGATDWNNAPVSQMMPGGKTFGQKLIELREYHKATAHTNRSLNDHIITAEELNKRTWGIGQDVRADFLTGPK